MDKFKCGHDKSKENSIVHSKQWKGGKVPFSMCKTCRDARRKEQCRQVTEERECEMTTEQLDAMIAEQLPTMPGGKPAGLSRCKQRTVQLYRRDRRGGSTHLRTND